MFIKKKEKVVGPTRAELPQALKFESDVLQLWQYLAENGYYDDGVREVEARVQAHTLLDIIDNVTGFTTDDFSYHMGPFTIRFIVDSLVDGYAIV